MDYQRIYNQIIDQAKKENRVYGAGIYYERHHIVPKCMGGEGRVEQWKTHPNIAVLTAREHFICHRLLCRIYPENKKLSHAFWFMSKQKSKNQERNYTVSSRVYEEAVSNLKFTEEHREKIRKTRIGKKTIVHPGTKEIKYVPNEELNHWIELGWENTNYRKGAIFTEEHKKNIGKNVKKRLTGKTGLQAQASKGPYTVVLESGEKYTAGSYPELVRATGIKYSTLQHRMTHKPEVFERGWKIYKGE